MQASFDVDYGPDEIGFARVGFDEMDKVSGSGSAELLSDWSLEIEFEYDNGDEAIFRAIREPASPGL